MKDHWDEVYRDRARYWGERPSELAAVAVSLLSQDTRRDPRILDVGCGYGRDSRYLARALGAAVLGIDPSAEGIAAARAALVGFTGEATREPLAGKDGAAASGRTAALEYRQAGFDEVAREVTEGTLPPFDVVFASNLYQLLGREERAGFRRALGALLKPAGRFFLSTLSTNDPQHYGEGEPVAGEQDSFVAKVYLHFCGDEELRSDFAALSVDELYESEYDEPHADGSHHHHVSWILVARRR